MNIACPKCGEEISLNDCFKDKAAENELKTATIKCTNQDCPWEGPSQFYKVYYMRHDIVGGAIIILLLMMSLVKLGIYPPDKYDSGSLVSIP